MGTVSEHRHLVAICHGLLELQVHLIGSVYGDGFQRLGGGYFLVFAQNPSNFVLRRRVRGVNCPDLELQNVLTHHIDAILSSISGQCVHNARLQAPGPVFGSEATNRLLRP